MLTAKLAMVKCSVGSEEGPCSLSCTKDQDTLIEQSLINCHRTCSHASCPLCFYSNSWKCLNSYVSSYTEQSEVTKLNLYFWKFGCVPAQLSTGSSLKPSIVWLECNWIFCRVVWSLPAQWPFCCRLLLCQYSIRVTDLSFAYCRVAFCLLIWSYLLHLILFQLSKGNLSMVFSSGGSYLWQDLIQNWHVPCPFTSTALLVLGFRAIMFWKQSTMFLSSVQNPNLTIKIKDYARFYQGFWRLYYIMWPLYKIFNQEAESIV